MRIEVSNKLTLFDPPEDLTQAVCERMTMPNPKWHENEHMGRSNWNTPRLLKFYQPDGNGGAILPRGYTRQLICLCRQFGIQYRIDDQRRKMPAVGFGFKGKLRPYQQQAVDDMGKRDFGTLAAATGSGKTIMGLRLIANRQQPALIVVHTKELLNQWIDRIHSFLGIPKADIGIIGAGKKRIGKQITVALVQSLVKCADEVSHHIGHLVVDECHRAPSRTFTEAVTAFDTKYMLGLTATPWRRDKLSRLIFWHLGDVAHQVDQAALIQRGDILQAEVITRETDFRTTVDPSAEYSRMLSQLTQDHERNRLIASDVAKAASNGGGICLVLSDRKAQCETLSGILMDKFKITAAILTGDTATKERQQIVSRLDAGEIKVLVATGSLVGEGFDCKGLSTLFLATPIKFSGRLLQYVGRVLRPAPGKERATVYDYVDPVGVLQASARERRRVYQKCFYSGAHRGVWR